MYLQRNFPFFSSLSISKCSLCHSCFKEVALGDLEHFLLSKAKHVCPPHSSKLSHVLHRGIFGSHDERCFLSILFSILFITHHIAPVKQSVLSSVTTACHQTMGLKPPRHVSWREYSILFTQPLLDPRNTFADNSCESPF